jgi:hypothetical protein
MQWALLAVLAKHERTASRPRAGLDTLVLAQRIHGRAPTRSELVSIRRALATLMRDGAVRHIGTREWPSPPLAH